MFYQISPYEFSQCLWISKSVYESILLDSVSVDKTIPLRF